jgi:hypothetical protein
MPQFFFLPSKRIGLKAFAINRSLPFESISSPIVVVEKPKSSVVEKVAKASLKKVEKSSSDALKKATVKTVESEKKVVKKASIDDAKPLNGVRCCCNY